MVDPHDTAEDHDHDHSVGPLVGPVTGAGAGTGRPDTSHSGHNHCKSSRHNY